MNYAEKIIGEIEILSPEGIKECFENGAGPNDLFKGLPLIYELTSGYARSDRFKNCVQVFVDYGLMFDDKPLLAVLLNDAATLQHFLLNDPQLLSKKYTLKSAFTPLYESTLLHVCAEYNHVDCAKVLVEYGAGINARAGTDENGIG
jgi:hypothetical protein